MLELLLRNKGRVLPRKLIEEKLYNWDDDVSSNAVEVHVHHLRRKLGSEFIRTVHGIGYTPVTHEIDATSQPARQADAYFPDSGLHHWAISSFVARRKTTDNVDELFDTQLMLFARRLSTLDLNEINAPQRMAHTPKKLKHGHIDDDALAFAIFSADGKMLLHDGDNGRDIPYRYRREGFDNGYLKDDNDLWRFCG